MSITFKDKVVWITGASSGIGEELVFQLARQGAVIVLSARRKDELERVCQKAGLNESNSFVLPLDLEHTEAIHQHTEKVIARFGKIDVLINNGGISQRSYAKDTPLSIDRRIMEINFFGTIALTKSVLPYMLEKKSGHIVVISSVSGKYGFFLRSAYAASKHALHGFFDSLRMEVYKNNIEVLLVCPGKVKTNISINAVTEKGEKHGVMDLAQAQGLSVAHCVSLILKAIQNKKEEVYIGGREVWGVWLKRFFPRLFSTIIRKQRPE